MSIEYKKCVVCGQDVVASIDDDPPRHYHLDCAEKAAGLAVVWHSKVLQHNDEDLSWARDKSEDEGEYYGVSFDDERGFFTASIVVHGIESEGDGATALEALASAYDDLQQEMLRITAKVWQIGQDT